MMKGMLGARVVRNAFHQSDSESECDINLLGAYCDTRRPQMNGH
jgi:hypothetical protein